jgi:hypothetical protein
MKFSLSMFNMMNLMSVDLSPKKTLVCVMDSNWRAIKNSNGIF